MIEILRNRLRQGHRTIRFPDPALRLPARGRGRPTLDAGRCPEGCHACEDACPTGAIHARPLTVDLGTCLLCPVCAAACPAGAIRFQPDPHLAARRREDLIVGAGAAPAAVQIQPLEPARRRLLRKSFKLRQVSAGGCNACEADLNVLGINVFDVGRFGIQFVASPRHADGIVVTGPVTPNMRQALLDTWEAVPSPRVVIAVGACAISGGPFAGGPGAGGIPPEIPVDLFIPGCPPHPYTLLDGLLGLLGRG